jgi:hypothetical protein
MLLTAAAVLAASGLAWWLLRKGEGEPKPAHIEGADLAHFAA